MLEKKSLVTKKFNVIITLCSMFPIPPSQALDIIMFKNSIDNDIVILAEVRSPKNRQG